MTSLPSSGVRVTLGTVSSSSCTTAVFEIERRLNSEDLAKESSLDEALWEERVDGFLFCFAVEKILKLGTSTMAATDNPSYLAGGGS